MNKSHRILKNKDFTKVIRSGKKIYTQNFSIYYCNSNNEYHIGITVSKKVSKLAVTRNLFKRRIVAAINELKLDDTFKKDVVIIVKPSTHDITYADIKKDISQVFSKITQMKGGEDGKRK